METRTKKVWLINFALGFAGKIQYKKVIKASKDCKKASMATLRGILDYAKDTEWGRQHKFSEILAAENDDELVARYQKNVPVTDYEVIRPLIERHKNGEENAKDGEFIVNTPITYTLPATGGTGTTIFTVVGASLMLLAVLGFILLNRKRTDGDGIR